jgi:tetratricopeptide (TPR) repeat protein
LLPKSYYQKILQRSCVKKMKLKECQKFQTIVLIAVIIGSMISLTSCSSKAKLLAKGEELLKQRKFQQAKMQFRSVSDVDKNSAEAFWGMARADEQMGNFVETIEDLRQVVVLDPKNLEAKSKLGNYFLLLDPPQISETEKLLTEVFAADLNFVEGHILKASLFSVQGKSNAEVIKILEQAIALDSARIDSYISLSRFYQKIENPAEAEKTVQKGISIVPNAAAGFLEYGRLLVYTNRAKDAEAQFKKATEVEPQSFDAHEELARYYVSQHNYEKAEISYKKLIEVQENSSESQVMLADFYSVIGRESDAIATFETILKDAPEFVQARYRLGEIYLERKEIDKSREQVEKLLAANDTDVEALILRSRINLHQNDTEAAIKDLEEVLKKKPSMKSALFFMAQSKLSLGQTDQARAFINDLEKYHPNYLFSKLLHIQASFAGNEPNKALTQSNDLLETVKNAFPNPETSEQDLAELHVRGLSSRGLAYIQLNNLPQAKADLQEVQRRSPTSTSAILNLARVAVAGKNLPEAQNLYEKALKLDAKSFDALNGLVNVLTKQKLFAQAHGEIDKQISENTGDKKILPALHYLKSDVFIGEKNLPSAETELKTAIEIDESYLPAYSAAAAILIGQNKTDEAIEQYQKVVAKKPDSAIYTLIALLYDAKQSFDESDITYRKALELNPDNAIAINNLSWNTAANGNGNLDEALTLMQNLTTKNPTVAGYFDTLGWVYFKKGLFAPAIESLKKATALDAADAAKNGRNPNPAYRLRLGSALASSGDKSSAKKEVEIALRGEKDLSKEEAQSAKNLLSSL